VVGGKPARVFLSFFNGAARRGRSIGDVQFTTAQHAANKPHDDYASLRKKFRPLSSLETEQLQINKNESCIGAIPAVTIIMAARLA
jgi:hypothetical protein